LKKNESFSKAVAYFKVLLQHSFLEMEENYNDLRRVSKGTESYRYINLLENTAFWDVTPCSLVDIY
jgi:hypothetical protein